MGLGQAIRALNDLRRRQARPGATLPDKLAGFSPRLRGVLTERGRRGRLRGRSPTTRTTSAARRRTRQKSKRACRSSAGEVFTRANIAREHPRASCSLGGGSGRSYASEQRVFEAFQRLKAGLGGGTSAADYERSLGGFASSHPILAQFFATVFVMVDEARCATIACADARHPPSLLAASPISICSSS